MLYLQKISCIITLSLSKQTVLMVYFFRISGKMVAPLARNMTLAQNCEAAKEISAE